MITVDELFEQPFEPEWSTHNQRIRNELRKLQHDRKEQEALKRAMYFQYKTGRQINEKYTLSALDSRLRLASRCDARGNYQNGLFTAASKKSSRTNKR